MWGQETPFELDTLYTTVEATSSPPFRTGCVPVKCPAPVWQCAPPDLHPRLLSPLLPSESHCLVQVASFPKHTANGMKLGKGAGNEAIVYTCTLSTSLHSFLPLLLFSFLLLSLPSLPHCMQVVVSLHKAFNKLKYIPLIAVSQYQTYLD